MSFRDTKSSKNHFIQGYFNSIRFKKKSNKILFTVLFKCSLWFLD